MDNGGATRVCVIVLLGSVSPAALKLPCCTPRAWQAACSTQVLSVVSGG